MRLDQTYCPTRSSTSSLSASILADSRAYYYIYHLALVRAVDNGFQVIAGEASHKQLWRNYSGSPEPNCRKLAEIAMRLKEKRERADYDKFYPSIDDELNLLINDARS